MPWVKSFDEEVAIENAMKVFWAKGFEPASIADLLKGTGLNRGSFYNAFGDKQQLFVRTLQQYDLKRHILLARLEALDNPKEAISQFIDSTVASTVADKDNKGCFLFNTALNISSYDEKVNEIVSNGVREIEAFLRRCIEVGQARDEISNAINPEATAKTLLALIVSIRVLGRGVFVEEALITIANQGKQLIGISLTEPT
ncbi:MAG: TetR/AcrR family transcriptional regulator [Magnetococcales bacterium]|nr:TetR/AcrR family transcriptional regulator [Magnetococcales bacterium]